jgi:hypothetical protein
MFAHRGGARLWWDEPQGIPGVDEMWVLGVGAGAADQRHRLPVAILPARTPRHNVVPAGDARKECGKLRDQPNLPVVILGDSCDGLVWDGELIE